MIDMVRASGSSVKKTCRSAFDAIVNKCEIIAQLFIGAVSYFNDALSTKLHLIWAYGTRWIFQIKAKNAEERNSELEEENLTLKEELDKRKDVEVRLDVAERRLKTAEEQLKLWKELTGTQEQINDHAWTQLDSVTHSRTCLNNELDRVRQILGNALLKIESLMAEKEEFLEKVLGAEKRIVVLEQTDAQNLEKLRWIKAQEEIAKWMPDLISFIQKNSAQNPSVQCMQSLNQLLEQSIGFLQNSTESLPPSHDFIVHFDNIQWSLNELRNLLPLVSTVSIIQPKQLSA